MDDLQLICFAGVSSMGVTLGRLKMREVAVVGLDLAKSVFQVHGIAADGAVVFRKQLRRVHVLEFFESLRSCLVGIEACA